MKKKSIQKIKPINPKIQKIMEDALGVSPRIAVKKEMGGKVQKMREGGNTISEADLKRLKEALKGAATAGMMGSGIGKGMPQGKKMGGKVQKMNMGGQVMDTTKSMPVGMMDGGKVKKMNMGGVIPGRGGMFKGMK